MQRFGLGRGIWLPNTSVTEDLLCRWDVPVVRLDETVLRASLAMVNGKVVKRCHAPPLQPFAGWVCSRI